MTTHNKQVISQATFKKGRDTKKTFEQLNSR
jgi:hypothetical protein